MTPLFDAHLDLAYNAMGYDRDITLPVAELRRREARLTGVSPPQQQGHTNEEHWGTATVSLPEMREGDLRVCLATLLARAPKTYIPQHMPRRFDLDYANPAIAEAAAIGQLAYYENLQRHGHIKLIHTRAQLDACWANPAGPIGCILSMEGCDPIAQPDDVSTWWARGLRTACLAHYRQGRYAFGTGGDGPLTRPGRQLLKQFQAVGVILDLVHTAKQGFNEALDLYDGPVFVSHANCRALVPDDRQLSDEQIQRVIQRNGVIGVVLDAWMLTPGYDRRTTPRNQVGLSHLADHIDHVAQLSGNCEHVGIGSDLDGGFGTEQCPHDLDTIADLQKLTAILERRGHAPRDIQAVFHNNWLRFFRAHLPA